MNQQFYFSSQQNKHSTNIFGLISYQQYLQDLLFNYAEQTLMKHTAINPGVISFHEIHSLIQEKNKHIELKLKSNKLGSRSQRVWIWLQYLAQRQNLAMHLHALSEFIHLINEVKSMIKFPKFYRPNRYRIYIESSSYLYRMKIKDSIGYLSLNENFISAPIGIKRDVLLSAFNRDKKALQRIRAYSFTDDFLLLEKMLSGKSTNLQNKPQGEKYNLALIFHRVNRMYFQDSLNQPNLRWSQRRSHRRLGSYQSQSDTITINRSLDREGIPDFVLDFIMYHELLHKKLGVHQVNSGRHNHNKNFKNLEKKFLNYSKANEWLKQNNHELCQSNIIS